MKRFMKVKAGKNIKNRDHLTQTVISTNSKTSLEPIFAKKTGNAEATEPAQLVLLKKKDVEAKTAAKKRHCHSRIWIITLISSEKCLFFRII